MDHLETATFGGGCFWCTEAIFKRLKGVKTVESGYSGGDMENPTYEDVCSGRSGHAESIEITFDPSVISYQTLLDVFFATHDPTTLNRQGNDTGPQYRSSIFYHDENQKKAAEETIKHLQESGKYKDPVVTKVEPYKAFYKAEANHQNFYENNREYPYCQVIIDPKVRKLLREFSESVKDEYKQEV